MLTKLKFKAFILAIFMAVLPVCCSSMAGAKGTSKSEKKVVGKKGEGIGVEKIVRIALTGSAYIASVASSILGLSNGKLSLGVLKALIFPVGYSSGVKIESKGYFSANAVAKVLALASLVASIVV